MRIISKFSDYYDAVQAEGQDRAMVFVREHTQYANVQNSHKDKLTPALAKFVALAAENTPGHLQLARGHRDYLSVEVEFGLILFAGRLYPYAELRRLPRALGGWSEPYFIYAHEELARVLEDYEYDIDKRDAKRSRWAARFGGKRVTTEEFFALSGSDRLLTLAMEERLGVVQWTRRVDLLNINPRLADLQFYRRLDAWQAFQELSMYWGNLAAPERTPVVIADKYRIAQHGFDKWSFRKPPEAA